MVCPPDLADCGRHRIKHWEEKWPRGQQEFLADPVRRQRAQVRWRERMALRDSVRKSVLPMLEFRGVPESWRPMYQDAAWRLARLAERHMGFQLASETEILIQVTIARGLDRAVLEQVSRVVLGFAPGEQLVP